MRGLKGKRIVLAGAATGVGAGAAVRLGEEGAAVVIGDLNLAGAEATAAEIRSGGGTAVAYEFDLADEASVVELVQHVVDEFGGIDGLVNAGADLSPRTIGVDKNLLETDMAVWQRTLDVNLLGYVRMSKAVVPLLIEAGGGSIVNVSSGAAVSRGDGKRPAYAASKSAILALTRHVATNWGRDGVRCNGVMPGFVMGPTQVQQNDTELQDMFLAQVPTTRLGRPSDLGAVIALLLSDDAEWINGQVWAIDGGANMRF
ncbi:SDR family NAD(P)-dependent oxidoreductase [Candidatus Poriferisocius sp.]|uniref:SDR family NAD(P)-dependent oxidoreductase n=1 Tax=Candidatus Poriferisocius sp. TaxID=3101276 RepID=UPI003B5AC9BE